MSLLTDLFFFYKQKTAYELRISDWSSDVCSSDLPALPLAGIERTAHRELYPCAAADPAPLGRCIDLRQQRAIETEHHRRLARLGPLPRLVGLGRDRLGLRLGRPGNEGIGRRLIHRRLGLAVRSEEHTSELQSLMRISYAVFCLKKKKKINTNTNTKQKQT